jgi:hypothetical protein
MSCGPVHGSIRFSQAAIELEGVGTEILHNEVAIAVRRAVQAGLRVSAEVAPADHDAVWVRVIVPVHVLRLGEGRLHRVVSRSGRDPILFGMISAMKRFL